MTEASTVISFMTANYVARQVGYRMTRGWSEGDRATQQHFQPLETFAARFEELLLDIRGLGFETIDLWTAHLNGKWAVPEHVIIAAELLTSHGLRVTSLAGDLGETQEELEASCTVAAAVGADLLAGRPRFLARDRELVLSLLQERDLRLALENHPERPEQMLALLGDDERLGTTVDTGWYATQRSNPVEAIERLDRRILHVHLKDIRSPVAHQTCRWGEGIVPVEACLRALQGVGYGGSYAIEHEPETFDPGEDCRAMLAMLRGWIRSG